MCKCFFYFSSNIPPTFCIFDFMKSTIDNPIAYFEYLTSDVNIKSDIEDLLTYSDYLSYTISLPDEVVFFEFNEEHEIRGVKIGLYETLKPKLDRELENSKRLMLEYYLENAVQRNINFFKFLFNSIQSLVRSSEFIERYPFLLFYYRELVQFINLKIVVSYDINFVLNEEGLCLNNVSNDNPKSKEGLIHEIFSFMKGKNEKGENILSEEEFELLIDSIKSLVSDEKLPIEFVQVKPRISNDLIRFSFWVLHHELYTTKKIRPYFIEFIKKTFKNFNESTLKSIRNQFGTKLRVKRDNFIPEIIKKHL